MWRYLFLCPVYLLASSLALLSDVGANLEYEYTLITSYLYLLALPIFGLLLKKRYLPVTEGKFDPPVAFDVLWILIFGPLIALLPAAYLFFADYCPCSQNGFAFWMLINALPAWVLAHAVMYGIMRARISGKSQKVLVSAYILGMALIVLTIAAQLWFEPQKRIVSLFGGFLHGPIYDDWIPFDHGLALARGSHFFWALLLLVLTWMRLKWRMIFSAIVLFSTALVLGGLAGKYPSTLNGKRVLDRLLPGKLASENFTLHYRPSDTQLEDLRTGKIKEFRPPKRIRRLHRDAAFHIEELKKQFGDATAPHTDIYVYDNDDAKKLWFGGGSTDVADVYTPSIHISARGWPHPTLRHELVHALASDMGFFGLGFHPNMAFTEGLAEALAPRPRSLSADDGTASLFESGRLPDVEALFSPFFWKESGPRAYTAASSLLAYLIDTYGLEKVLRLYSGDDWEEAIATNRGDVVKAWRQKILADYDKARYDFLTEALYRAPGILQDLCPHSKADYNRSRHANVYARLRQPLGFNPEQDYLPWLLSLNRDDKEIRLRVWKGEIERVATDRFLSIGRLSTWVEALEKARAKPAESLEDAEMMLLQSDILRLLDLREESLDMLTKVKSLSAKKYLGAAMSRQIDARIRIEQRLPASDAKEWRQYLSGWRRSLPDVSAAAAPWIVSYLRLRGDGGRRLTAPELEAMLAEKLDKNLDPEFHREWYRLLAERFMLRDEYENAVQAYKKAVLAAGSGYKEYFEVEVRRAEYYVSQGVFAKDAAEKADPTH